MPLDRRSFLPMGLLISLQILDVIVHVATQQIEPLRIASNIVMIIAALAGVRLAGSTSRAVLFLAAGLYSVLNLAFVFQHGLANPSTGALRVPFIAFVVASLVIAYWLCRRLR